MTTTGDSVRAAGYGALAAVMGAACMTVVRSAARRTGLIQKTVPQVLEERLTARARSGPGESSGLHGVLDQVAHLGYGAALGAAYGALVGAGPRLSLARGGGLGVGTWLLGAGVVLPATGATRAPWKRSPAENGVDLLAHVVFGVATELVRQDLMAQSGDEAVSGERRRSAAAG